MRDFPEEIAAIRKTIADLPIGKEAELTVRRGKETLHVKATPEKLTSALGGREGSQKRGG